MKGRLKMIVLVAVLLGAAGTALLRRRDFRYAGTVEAVEVSLSPRLASQVESVAVREGETVKKGQLLVTLDCADYKLAAGLAERDFERTERLYKQGSTPQEAFDHARNRRDDSQLKVSWCRLESPIDGTVLARLHEPGEAAAPGVKLLTLADLSAVYAYFYVPQTVLHKVSVGQEVQVYLPEAGPAARRGRVAFIRPEAEFTPKNVQTREERTRLVYGVKVELDNPDGVFKPGMPVEADLPR